MSAAPLHKLEVVTTCNTSDEDVVANIRATSKRPGTKWLALAPPKERTLVIVGSGPSAWDALAQLKLGEYDVMALNGAYSALIEAGYAPPKYYAQLDARAFNVPFLRCRSHATEYILAAQVHPDVFNLLDGYDVTTFHLNTETEQQVYGGTEGLFLGSAGGTIGTTALAIAGALGYRHLILVGYDSSFSGDKSHLVAQPQNAGQNTLPVEFEGRWYITTPTLAAQVSESIMWLNALRASFPDIVVDLIGEGLFYDFVSAHYGTGKGPPPPTSREEELARYPS